MNKHYFIQGTIKPNVNADDASKHDVPKNESYIPMCMILSLGPVRPRPQNVTWSNMATNLQSLDPSPSDAGTIAASPIKPVAQPTHTQHGGLRLGWSKWITWLKRQGCILAHQFSMVKIIRFDQGIITCNQVIQHISQLIATLVVMIIQVICLVVAILPPYHLAKIVNCLVVVYLLGCKTSDIMQTWYHHRE